MMHGHLHWSSSPALTIDAHAERLADMYLAVGDYEASDQHYTQAIELLEKEDTKGLQVIQLL